MRQRPPNRKYTSADRERAFDVYAETRSVVIAAKLTGIPAKTISKWKTKWGWDEKAETALTKRVADFDRPDPKFEEICRDLGMDPVSISTLREVNTISKICLSSILGKNEKLLDNLSLKPVSFKEAVGALKTCWETKGRILSANMKKEPAQDNRKIDFIQIVHQHMGEENADDQRDEGESLPGPDVGRKSLPH